MIPSHHQRNSPNRLIKCSESSILNSTPSLIDLLQVPPSLSLTHNLVDYRSFPAPEKEEAALKCLHIPEPSESTHEKRRTLLRERQSSPCQQPQSVRRSMVDLIPPTRRACSSEDDDDSSDEESEVMFALKVSRPARLVPRPTTRTRRGSVEHWGNGSIAALSLLDESIALQSTSHKNSSSSHNLTKLGLALPRRQTVGDFSQSCVPNHDSFQTSANFSIPLPAPAANANTGSSNTSCNTSSCSTHKPDPRKQRKSMMNWLANRQASRHLLDAPSKDPQPPAFVKVIYLPEDLEELDMEDPIQKESTNTTQPEDDIVMGSKPAAHHNIAPAIQRYLDLLENSYQHKVASSTA